MALKIQEVAAPTRLFVGMYGTPGSGKSFGAAAMGARWVKRKGGELSIWVFDTEDSWGWLTGKLSAVGIKLVRADASEQADRGVADLREFLVEAHKAKAGIVCVDSLTHIVEKCDADYLDYLRNRPKRAKDEMEASDYGPARKDFKKLCSQMLTSKLDLIICGRHGLEYGVVGGKNVPIGHKMKAADFGYEPDLLIEAKRTEEKESKFANEVSTWHTYTVDKDRSGTLSSRGPIRTKEDGKEMQAFGTVAKGFDPFFDFLLGEPEEQAQEGGE